MNIDPQQIASIIDGRAAAIETLDNDIMVEERVVALIDLSIFSISRMRADICQYNQCFIDGAAPF
jgi:hypothetical protein